MEFRSGNEKCSLANSPNKAILLIRIAEPSRSKPRTKCICLFTGSGRYSTGRGIRVPDGWFGRFPAGNPGGGNVREAIGSVDCLVGGAMAA